MNILYVVDSTTVSGAENVVLQYIDALRPPAHRVHVFLAERNTRFQAALSERNTGFTTTRAFSERIVETTANPKALLQFSSAFVRVGRALAELIRTRNIQLVHSISFPASLYTAVAVRLARCPHVWHEHNIKKRHTFNPPLYRFTASSCSSIVGPSNAVTGNLAKFGINPSKLQTVYNGIDLSRFRPNDRIATEIRNELGVAEDQIAIGLFGQMLPYKGHRTLIAAVEVLVSRYPNLRCFLVGALENPSYQEELKRLIEERGLTNRITFTGWRRDVPDVIRAMDVVVVATTTPEPAALALMEGMAMERPVVATDTGGTPEIVMDGQTGCLFAAGDASSLARALDRVLSDRELARRMGAAGRVRVETHFSMQRHLADMTALYARAAAEAP